MLGIRTGVGVMVGGLDLGMGFTLGLELGAGVKTGLELG